MYVSFPTGTHWGYKFDENGNTVESKSGKFNKNSSANAEDNLLTVPNREGYFLRITNGVYEGFLIKLGRTVSMPDPKLPDIVHEPDPEPEPEPEPGLWDPKARPFSNDSPWNTKLPSSTSPHSRSDEWIGLLEIVSIDSTQYTYPVYFAEQGAELWTVTATGRASVNEPTGERTDPANKQLRVPLPADALPAAGSDAQIIVIDRATGDEFDLWQVRNINTSNRTATVSNGSHYKKSMYGPGTTYPHQYTSQGAGLPYYAGLIRPHEIEAGKIDHALQILGNWAGTDFVYPATKSDGNMEEGIPEGSRIYMDPSIDLDTARDRAGRLLGPEAKIIARALQEYGAIVVDVGGNTGKIRPESNITGQWSTLPSINWCRFPSEWLRVAAQS